MERHDILIKLAGQFLRQHSKGRPQEGISRNMADSDGVHADAIRREFDRHSLGEFFDRCFCGGINECPGDRTFRPHAGNIDDRSPGLPQIGQGVVNEKNRGKEINLENLFAVGLIDVLESAGPGVTGRIIDQEMQGAGFLTDLLDQSPTLVAVGEISGKAEIGGDGMTVQIFMLGEVSICEIRGHDDPASFF